MLSPRASHVNSGTSFRSSELRAGRPGRRVFGSGRLQVGSESGSSTAYGGLSLATALVGRLELADVLDRELRLLKRRQPFSESDHVLTQVYNLFVGGTCLEDIANLQCSEPVRRLLGAERIPDPTTAGDFLRRFEQDDLAALDGAIDEAQRRVWRLRYGRRKQELALVDLDSHVHEVYGHQKQGADLSYKGTWSYHPLVISLAGTQECLRLINRPGNSPSAEGAAGQLEQLFPLLCSRFRKLIVRGDSAFAQQEIFDACEAAGQFFAVVSGEQRNFPRLAEALPEKAWKPYVSPEQRTVRARRRAGAKRRRRRRRPNLRRQRMRARGKKDLKLCRQWVAEIPYRPTRSAREYRLVIRRQKIEASDGQGQLFDLWRYRYVLSNLRRESAQDVMDLTYQRCDQENIIEQLQNGIAGMRMPTGELLSNGAHLTCARLAHNLKSWLGQLALPEEVTRWGWKRFRHAFVIVAARVIHHARQIHVRLADSHRFTLEILRAHERLRA
jgi:hypothetical protein